MLRLGITRLIIVYLQLLPHQQQPTSPWLTLLIAQCASVMSTFVFLSSDTACCVCVWKTEYLPSDFEKWAEAYKIFNWAAFCLISISLLLFAFHRGLELFLSQVCHNLITFGWFSVLFGYLWAIPTWEKWKIFRKASNFQEFIIHMWEGGKLSFYVIFNVFGLSRANFLDQGSDLVWKWDFCRN